MAAHTVRDRKQANLRVGNERIFVRLAYATDI
jgi:hypothetical protein